MKHLTIQFGWGAASFADQLPGLMESDAKLADDFNKAIILLAVHGIISGAEQDRAIRRATRRIESDLLKAMESTKADPA